MAERGSGAHLVTGAFGYTGRYVAERLLAGGHEVRTLTRSVDRRNAFGGRVRVFPLEFGDPARLRAALEGVEVLYNTYWVRFSRAGFRQEEAVENTRRLFAAAQAAGVARVVHVSITNPAADSPYEYFRGKARLERALAESGLSHAILRPAVIYGPEDVLINNIAWMLRRFPVFGLFGDGSHRLQPILVEDFAGLLVEAGRGRENLVRDAIGPETFTVRALVELLGDAIGCRRPIVALLPWLGIGFASALGLLLRDVLLTRPEIDALMDGLLATSSPPAGRTRLSEWARASGAWLGRRYTSELARRRHPPGRVRGGELDVELDAVEDRSGGEAEDRGSPSAGRAGEEQREGDEQAGGAHDPPRGAARRGGQRRRRATERVQSEEHEEEGAGDRRLAGEKCGRRQGRGQRVGTVQREARAWEERVVDPIDAEEGGEAGHGGGRGERPAGRAGGGGRQGEEDGD
ncbi:MAG: NAD(P)H-binding protein, partial [Planctomycetota bacterium]